MPKERFQRALAHEIGHVPQFEYGAIGMDVKDFIAIEGSMQTLWDELCRIKGVKSTQAPLTVYAFSNAVLNLIPVMNGSQSTFNDKMTEYRSLIKRREGLARFKSLPLPEALRIGLTKTTDRELVAATTQGRWSIFGR